MVPLASPTEAVLTAPGQRTNCPLTYGPSHGSGLWAAHTCIPNKLKELKIPFLSNSSGLYVCINLKLYLDPRTLGEDLVFHHCFLYHKLILSHGKPTCARSLAGSSSSLQKSSPPSAASAQLKVGPSSHAWGPVRCERSRSRTGQ